MLLGCSADSPELRVSARDATTSECANGGLVLTFQNETYEPICDGVDGPMGAPGEIGATGATGARGPIGAAGQDAQNVADVLALIRPKNSSVLLVECTDGTTFSQASGTKTTAGTVITAEHVVRGVTSCDLFSAAPVTLVGSMLSSAQRGERDEVEMQVEWTSQGAVLRGLEPKLQTHPQVGDLVTVVGYPGLYDGVVFEHQFTTGFVTAASLATTLASVPTLEGKDVAWESAWSTDAVSWHGNSGGPVFDADSNWIGLLVGTFNGGPDQEGPDISVVLPLF
jgi:hypothetical protein